MNLIRTNNLNLHNARKRWLSCSWLGVFVVLAFQLNAQVQPQKTLAAAKDTLVPELSDSLTVPLDTAQLLAAMDSALVDSLMTLGVDPIAYSDSLRRDSIRYANSPLSKIKTSEDALDEEVTYNARDSMIYDLVNETVYLYGGATVSYTDINLEAGKIIFNWGTNEVIAEGLRDTTLGQVAELPVFKDKNQAFEAKHIRYNVKTRKGMVRNVVTKQGNDLFVVGAKAKFASVEVDSAQTENVVYSEDAIFTTCDHPEPHFGIRSKKQKVIPNKVVVVGPSNLEIMGVPTPLWLPFGFYPITDQGSTGLIFPRDFENSDLLGFGLKGVGWFFPINDYMNLQVTADYYLRGTWGLTATSQYKRKYKFGGNFAVSYSSIVGEDEFADRTKNNAMQIRWGHTQDQKANPIHNFSANVNIATNNYIGQRETAAQTVQNNRLSSSVTYNRKFPGKKWGFTASFNHNQSRIDSTVNFTLPNLLFTTGTFQPFKSQGVKKKWHDNINFSYRAQAEARFNTKDDAIFTQETLDSSNPGMKHEVTASFNTRVFDIFNFGINSAYSENWYIKSTRKTFDPTLTIDSSYTDGPDSMLVLDTTGYGKVLEDFVYGFEAFHNLKNTSINVSSKLFSTMLLKKGKLRGLRHVMTPSFSFGYNPSQTRYFDNLVDTDTRIEENEQLMYSIFEDVIYDKPSNRKEQLNLGYSFGNTLEAKLYSRKEKETKNVKIIESFNLSGRYDFAADSLNWSDPAISARTTFFNKMVSVQFRSTLSLYEKDSETNRKVNKFLLDEGKGPVRMDNASLTFNSGISVKQFMELVRGKDSKVKVAKGSLEELLSNFRIKHNLVMSWTTPNNIDTFNITTNTIDLFGGLKISENWNISISRIGYNFVKKEIVYPDFTFSRNLHCWQMSVSWQPLRNTFGFTLGVRPGTLDFIKVPYKRNAQDGFIRR